MKKVLGNSFHFAKEPKRPSEVRLKSKKASTKIKMQSIQIPGGVSQMLNIHRFTVKMEPPSTSEFLAVNNGFHQSMPHFSNQKKIRGRPKIDGYQRPVKQELGMKSDINVKPGKRRGRPSKCKVLDPRSLGCGFCNFKAEDFFELESHLKAHADQNIYECPYCKSTFSQKGNLITHIRTHTKEKPFKCLLCDFAASQKVNLQVHMRTHTKEKPFKCNLCDFSTAQKCNLVAHVTRRHSNVEVVKKMEPYENQWGNVDSQLKFYKCGMCAATCRLKREMVDHVKMMHPFSPCEYQTIDVLK